MRAFVRAGLAGAVIGVVIFVADLVVTASTHGRHLDPSLETLALVAVVSVFVVLPCALIGGLLRLLGVQWERATGKLALVAFVASSAGFFLFAERPVAPRDDLGITVEAGRPHDVIWIVIDTLRADALHEGVGTAGELTFPDAPELGAFAEDCVVFTEAEAPSGWTIPSTAALLTGIHPASLGARAGLLPSAALTVAELLRSAGYSTVAHVDNTLLSESNGFAAGFDRFEKRIPMDYGWNLATSRLMPAALRENARHRMHISYSGADRLFERARADVDAAGDDPLFLYVHAMDVHAPYWSRLEDEAMARAAADIPGLDGTGRDDARRSVNALSESQRDAIRALYQAELRTVDAEIGELLRHLDEVRGLSDALVVVTSDHGEEFWEHGRMGHGHALWGEVVRVPLLMRLPDSLAQGTVARVDEPTSLIDVLPTVAELLELAVDGESLEFEGTSRVAALRGGVSPAAPLHAEQFRFNRQIHRWRDEDLVLVRSNLPDERVEVRLFDVALDPNERVDLSADRPEDVARLTAALEVHLASLDRDARDAGEATQNAQGLEHLGY